MKIHAVLRRIISFELSWLYATSIFGYLPGPLKKDDFTRELVVGRCGPGSRVASLAAASAASFPGMFEWLGIHCTMIVAWL